MKRRSKARLIYLIATTIFAILFQPYIFITQNIAKAQTSGCVANFQSVSIPLTDLGNQEYIRMDGSATGYFGGLYPNGENVRPQNHETAGIALANSIKPLNRDGNIDPENGKIVFVSIGMSNTSMEFDTFMQLAKDDHNISPNVLLINGALSSQTSDRWVDPNAITWQNIANILDSYQLTPSQVQVAWIKLTQTRGGDFPAKALALESDLEKIVQNLKAAYPNVKIAFLSSRIYSYTYFRGLSPEPNAFETGYSVKWLIEKQLDGDPTLNYDPQKGAVVAPYLSWGPYLWANGQNPRSDGLTWLQEDLEADCTHPTASGKLKVANMLLEFFKNDSITMPWFLTNPENDFPLYLPIVTQTTTPVFEPTVSPLPSSSPTPTVSPTVEIAITMTPMLISTEPSSNQSPNIFVILLEWIKRLFSRK
ncbi:MAG: hypothetical protein ACYDH1_11625 [Anaerolineaceae bacterium]